MSEKMSNPHMPIAATELDVSQILTSQKQGSSKHYDIFVNRLADPGIQDPVLVRSLRGLKECITLLGKEHEILVGVILKVDWVSRDSAVVKEYQSFIINLVSAHTFYLRACLRMVVKAFIPKFTKAQATDDSAIDEITRNRNDKAFGNLHTLLKTIIQIVPMTPTVLQSLLVDFFPYMTKETYIQECYVKNLLHVANYLTEQRCHILELIVDRMTKLDVRSPRDDINRAEEEADDGKMEEDIIFDMVRLKKDAVEQAMLDQDGVQRQSSMEEVRPMNHKEADRLDVMMDFAFRYIHNTCHNDGQLDWTLTKKLYKDMLLVFDRILLPTHAACHVPFIMFYICSFKDALCEGFLDYLWKKVQNPNVQSIFRQAAVAYIASLLARAKFISVGTVKACLDLMVAWAHSYISQTSSSSSKADVAHHGPFYSVCQAIFYVFVYRHKELLGMSKGFKYAQSLNLQTLVTCRLNPLRVCLPLVALTFASITRRHQLAYCDTIIEKNKRSMLPVAGEGGPSTHSQLTLINPLDSFFPFDPYLLNRSGKFILPMYREYDGPVENPDEDGSEDEEEDEELYEDSQNDNEDSLGMAIGSYGKSPVSDKDILMYGISPGFKHFAM